MSGQEENPDIQWAIDLLTPGPDYELSLISKYFNYIAFGATGQIGVITQKLFSRRPLLSGLHIYPIVFVLTMGVAHVTKIMKNRREGLRDAILKDYIRKFPDDFKPPVKRTWNDLFHPWTPWR
ncbi:uncharacterized protein LOC106647404 [Copidosoma floridanum]|uniref:uncharacterized protein LOC106647404 n=1 Tax=Copidosoma floridanum TaxID=29053 RepID=UPI0006C9485E|nr:uncharacterized protein LOC106647404 [Copidosoma floridanum]XP_014219281.1 uncharacterized protein LOC106647404 [Copidosoma floridanum]